MPNLSERITSRSNSDLSDSLPKVSFTTITGRRVLIGRMYNKHTRRILKAAKGVPGRHGKKVTRTTDWNLTKWLITELVREVDENSQEKFIDYDSLTIGEETDLLLLMRLSSLGRPLDLKYTCPVCGEISTPHVDCSWFKRFLLQPGSSAPEEYQIGNILSRYDPIQDIPDDKLTVDWSELPKDYHTVVMEHHRDWTIRLPQSNLSVEFHLSMARDKPKLGEWVQSEDTDILINSLSQMIVSIDGIVYVDDKNRFLDSKSEKACINKLSTLTLYDLLYLRDAANDEQIGVDCALEVKCEGSGDNKGCGHVGEYNVPFDAPFFLPDRVIRDRSSSRMSRYAREPTQI